MRWSSAETLGRPVPVYDAGVVSAAIFAAHGELLVTNEVVAFVCR
jgi:hypothetical protein